MPRPVFDIKQYELRGTLPPVYTQAQFEELNKALSRVNGQVDFTAQMLGYNGPNYWGRPSPSVTGEYNWEGLARTMNEKRQMMTAPFGVYAKDRPYEQRPAPFNRSEILASGDGLFEVQEIDGKTVLSPLGQRPGVTYLNKPNVFVGAQYIFNDEVEFKVVHGADRDTIFYVYYNNLDGVNKVWTRLIIKQPIEEVGVRRRGSTAEYELFDVLPWTDPSDWRSPRTLSTFLGMWGNKGNNYSFDAAFDSLSIHGFNETLSLGFEEPKIAVKLDELLAKVGLEPTPYTRFANTEFGFRVGNSPTIYPLPPFNDAATFFDNGSYDTTIVETGKLVNGVYDTGTILPSPTSTANSGTFQDRNPDAIYLEQDFVFSRYAGDCNYDMVLTQQLDDRLTRGIGSITFEYKPTTEYAYTDLPCVQWVWNPQLDNGDFTAVPILPDFLGPWATANDGEYGTLGDVPDGCYDGVAQQVSVCEGGAWCGFDDGEFDKPVQPNCGIPDVPVITCADSDDGVYDGSLPDTEGEIDSGIYIYGIALDFTGCTATNGVYDRAFIGRVCDDVNNDFYLVPGPQPEPSFYVDGSFLTGAGNILPPYDSKVDDGALESANELPPIDDCIPPDDFYEDLVDTDCADINGMFFTRIEGLPDISGNSDAGIYLSTDSPEFEGCLADGDVYLFDTIAVCDAADAGQFGNEGPPDYETNDCDIECGNSDAGDYEIGKVPYAGPDIIDGETYTNPPAESFTGDVTACPVESVKVLINEVFASLTYKMEPNLANAMTPLRLWKNHVLQVTDRVPNAGLEYHNFLQADVNRGVEPFDSYRYFARLPIEYPRNGKDWNRASAVCSNQSYFSTPPQMAQTENDPTVARPKLYAECYYDDSLPDYTIFYDESFLVSTIRTDTENTQSGFEDSVIDRDLETAAAFVVSVITAYDAFEVRTPKRDGFWKGEYFFEGDEPSLTGYITNDLESQALIPVPVEEYPVYDESIIRKPDIEFPDTSDEAALKNYVVSYAYFTSDYSASDDPVFDPDQRICWRDRTVTQETLVSEKCVESEVTTNTAYLLHPV